MSIRGPRRVGSVCALCACLVPLCLRLGVAEGQAPATPRGQGAGGQTCAKECHKDILGRRVMHGPVQTDCGACHVLVGDPVDHKFAFVVPVEQLCQRCHQLPHQNVTHAPVREGRCRDCHDPHGSKQKSLLVADPKRDLCLRCHKTDFAKMSFVHGPVAVGACIVCHAPHGSSQPSLLVEDAKSLCLACHGEIQASGEPGVHMHGALEQGCTRCHDPHASNHKFQLRESAPELCMQCHQETFDRMTAGATVVHGAVTEEGGCSVCHEPHSSRSASLVRNDNEMDMCLSCHDKALKTPQGAAITNMAALFASNPDKHGPVREGACTACHDPHAGKNFRMLTEDYPSAFYAPFEIDSFKLCFRCHIPDLVLNPSGRGLTQFRDGDTNLHWLHVNQEKGRTCRACHEVHASKRPAHIREAVPFGTSGWLLELNFQQSEQGGQCSPGCHTIRTYIRTGPASPVKPVTQGSLP